MTPLPLAQTKWTESKEGRHYDIAEEACEKWNTKANLSLTPNELSKSFKRHSILIDDSYAKYIQFRTLYQRFLLMTG